MPIYEYVCTTCDHRADILHGINDPGPRYCPSCGAEGTLRKRFAPPTIHFKGSGWAKKDRGGTSGATRASRSSSSGDSGSAGESSSGESGSSSGSGSSSSSGSSSPSSSDAPKPSSSD